MLRWKNSGARREKHGKEAENRKIFHCKPINKLYLIFNVYISNLRPTAVIQGLFH